jgi:hypothetical protein
MSVHSIAVVPAATPPRSSCGSDEVLEDARRALAAPGRVQTRVLVTAGPSGVVHDRAVVRADGGTGDVEVPVDGELMAAVAGRTGFSRGRTDRLDGDLARLVRWSADIAPEVALLPLEIPEHAGTSTLEAIATGLRSAAEATPRTVGVVAAGDLAVSDATADAGHATGSDAARFDDEVLGALRAGDVAALGELGPHFASEVGARGWGPLLVASLLAGMTGLTLAGADYRTQAGRGRVVVGP